ncbi:hypothetical protein EJ07DRAFT_151791 [Lizonia empirigonia]|nr:hypothetical protein EJ07DRAFT_151791 [Lizonia empirigonia]
MAKHPYDDPDPVPIYFLLIFAIFLCIYFAWIGSVAVRLYVYNGALGPEPERFVILPAYLRDRSPQRGHQRRITAFPIPAPPKSPARELGRLSGAARVHVADVDTNELPDPAFRAFFAEQRRISRLSAFVQDDCGDGSDFPDVPFAVAPVEVKHNTLAPPDVAHRPSTTHAALGLKELDANEWLVVDDTYKAQHSARDLLLTKKHAECIQVRYDGETACEELLDEVVKFLVATYPDSFSIRTVNRRKHIRNEITREEWSLVRPFDCHPLEVCARLATEDFSILLKGEFTQQYYLQASATLYPTDWRVRNVIGKPLSHMHDSELSHWNEILPLLLPNTFLSHTTHIPPSPHLSTQASQPSSPSPLSAQHPQHSAVRRATHVFRRLPVSRAVVVASRRERGVVGLDGE